ncbi:MAG: hypothetical protein ACFE9L_00080 [Candidatus Hodarchaeota archaeon]
MSEIIELSIDQYKERLNQYILGELPLRDPSITVIHCPKEILIIVHKEFVLFTKEQQIRHPNWHFRIINAEKLLFEILRDYGYIDNEKFAQSCNREELKIDLEGSGRIDFIKKIKEELNKLKETKQTKEHPPFLILLNIHACYNFIQTKDVIAQLINQKGVLLLITYLEGFRKEKDSPYKEANYNVNTVYLTS